MRIAAVVLAGALVVAGCSADETDSDAPRAGEIIRVTPAALESGAVATPTPVLEGQDVGELYNLEAGDCFNEYEIVPEEAPAFDLTTRVDCRRPHDAEVYAEVDHPAPADVPYLGKRAMEDWAIKACYELFAEFVGLDYEYSALQIGVIPPAEDNWNFGPYRTTECYVYAADGQLSGSMRNSGV